MSHNNMPREIGTAWEVTVAAYGNAQGFPLERRALAGRRDLGDLMGLPGWVIGCKSEQTIRLSQYMNDLRDQKENTIRRSFGDLARNVPRDLIGVEIVKRRGYATGRAYAVMEYDDLIQVWRDGDL
jgi:hypothetical protein